MAQVRGSAATAVMIMVTMSMLFQCQAATTTDLKWTFARAHQSKTVNRGDSLNFTYSTPIHNLVEVKNLQDYTNCKDSANSTPLPPNKPVLFPTAGTRYFICTKGTHCAAGNMKINVTTI